MGFNPSVRTDLVEKKQPLSGRQRLFLFWPARRDSNPRPSESESAAISSFATGGCADIIAQKKAGSKSGGRAAQKYFSDGQQNWKKLLQKSEVSLIIYELLIFSATVAQLVEQLIRNQQVAGSSPASSSRKGTCFCRCFFFFYFACCTAALIKIKTAFVKDKDCLWSG